MKDYLLVGTGGAIGSMLRYAAGFINPMSNAPTSTLLVNIIGSFILGIVAALSLKTNGLTDKAVLFLGVGICGGFTTFSTFSLENLRMLQQGKFFLVVTYTLLSILGGITAAWLGYKFITH